MALATGKVLQLPAQPLLRVQLLEGVPESSGTVTEGATSQQTNY